MAAIRIRMGKIISGKLMVEEQKYFTDNLVTQRKDYRLAQTCGIPKIHKEEIHVPLRLVVSQCGSILDVASTYINYKLASLVKKCSKLHKEFV